MNRIYQPPTEKQKAARQRNWHIRRLRGLYAQCGILTHGNRTLARQAINNELLNLGARAEVESQ